MYPKQLESALYGAFASALLISSHELGVFRLLSKGSMSASKLAVEINSHAQAVERLLFAAESIGLLEREREKWRIPEVLSPFLDPSENTYIGPLLNFHSVNTVPLLSYITESVRTGSPQWKRLSDSQGKTPFELIYRDSDTARSFFKAMWDMGYESAKQMARIPFIGSHHILVDIGGGTGSFTFAMLEQNTLLSAVVFDLPVVEAYFEEVAKAQLMNSRVRFVGGDFWSDPIPNGDLYALGYVLSDLCDERAHELIQRLYAALPGGGRLMVLERFLDERRSAPFKAVMQDIAMMLETGGRHRTASEYEKMLERAGFLHCETHRTEGEKHMVVGIKRQRD